LRPGDTTRAFEKSVFNRYDYAMTNPTRGPEVYSATSTSCMETVYVVATQRGSLVSVNIRRHLRRVRDFARSIFNYSLSRYTARPRGADGSCVVYAVDDRKKTAWQQQQQQQRGSVGDGGGDTAATRSTWCSRHSPRVNYVDHSSWSCALVRASSFYGNSASAERRSTNLYSDRCRKL
jgi:hypothetical protein